MNSEQILIIEAGRAERHYWGDLWRYRGLLYFLAWRDILVRYKQTVLGVSWAVLRPLLTMLILTLVFSKVAKLPSDGVSYPVLVLVALLPWQLFAGGFSEAGNSLVSNASMISKVYFPRLIVPASSIVVSFVDFLITGLLLAAVMAWYGVVPGWRVLFLPLFVVLALSAAIGVGLFTAALSVKYRDFRFVVPFAVQLGLYISPVGFSTSVIPEEWRVVYSINPMVGIIDGFRWSLTGGQSQIFWPGLVMSVALVTAVLFGGIAFFRRTEKTFADVI